ncbi:TonB-dependent receptor plug domain-containing protein [Flavobacterium phycosphaerae]|uniref:TonB-dependent receptor plug domain-containing protein n=1 Tax=Flavobacterium phycosphaerae TaxID=2697515 RepID=UPI0013893D6D|nr:TonB-dependent receptor [Flavobacterium phycosphaerae]
MKKIMLFFFLLLWISFSHAQQKEKYLFTYTNTKITKVLSDIEKAFDVKYSYADSIVGSQKITLPKKQYFLTEINAEIENQSSLQVVKINDRFYSVAKAETKETIDKIYALKEVIVEEFLAKGIKKTDQNYILYPQKIATLPGVTDADILLSFQQLPGVKSPNETAAGLHIRGGTSDQNLILLDGIRLYHPGHLFGMISSINPNVEQTVNYYNKAVNPKFGERVSSIIDIKSTDKIADKTKVNAGINALNADAYFQTPLYKDIIGLQVSGRKSYTEWLQLPTFNQLENKVFQHTNFNNFDNDNQFQFYDFSTKLNFKPNDKTAISVTGLVINNDLDYKSVVKTDSLSNQKMNIKNYGFGLNWSQKYSSKFTQQLQLFYSVYNFEYEKRQEYQTNKFEAFKKLNRVVDSGITSDFGYNIAEKSNIEFGYQFLGNDISHLLNSYNQDVAIDLNLKHRYNVTQVGYVFFRQDIGRWSFQPGLRYNYYSKIKANSFEPRILVQNKLSETLICQVSYERRSQILSQVRENAANDLSLENYVWILSDNEKYPVQKANQFTAGIIYKSNGWLLDVDSYYKNITGITSFTLGFLSQNDASIHHGKGFTKGVDVLLQKSMPTWRAWATYTYQDSQNKFEDLNEGDYFQANSSIKHSFNVAVNKKWNNYMLALGWFWHSGKPYSNIDDSGQITSYNSETLPNYHRLDVSGSYEFKNKRGHTYKIGISVYNLYNRNEIISKEFERKYSNLSDFANPRYSMQNYYSLQITPNVFLRVNL